MITLKPMSGARASGADQKFLLNTIVGKKQAISYFQNENGLCKVTVMVADVFNGVDVPRVGGGPLRSGVGRRRKRAHGYGRGQVARVRVPGAGAGAHRKGEKPGADLSVKDVKHARQRAPEGVLVPPGACPPVNTQARARRGCALARRRLFFQSPILGTASMTRSTPAQSAQSLDKVAVFTGLTADTLARIQKRCSWRHYEPGEPIVDYLDTSNDVFFITAGEARVSIYSVAGKAVTFTDLGPGDMFGEYAAIDGARRSATIEARTACHVASMSARAFRELLQQEPAVMLALLRPVRRENQNAYDTRLRVQCARRQQSHPGGALAPCQSGAARGQ